MNLRETPQVRKWDNMVGLSVPSHLEGAGRLAQVKERRLVQMPIRLFLSCCCLLADSDVRPPHIGSAHWAAAI